MTTSEELTRRRIDFATLMSRGAHLHEAITAIHEKHGTSHRMLYQDWQERDQWGVEIVEPLENDKTIADALFRIGEVRRQLWSIIDGRGDFEGADIKTRLKALIQAADLEFRILETAQSLGAIHKEPLKLDIMARADELQAKMISICGDDQQLQDAVTSLMLEIAESEN